MSVRGDAIVHGAGALLALALAVWATEAEKSLSPEAVELADCEVTSVRFRSPRRDVDVNVDDQVVWIEVIQRPEEGPARERRFRGGTEALAYLDSLSPLMARRSLGVLEGAALEEVGLASSDTTWSISCGSNEREFEVGGRAYGTGDRYVRSGEGGSVHLLPVAAIRALNTAEVRLMQRKLHSFEFAAATAARVTVGDRVLELEHRNRRAHDAAWVEAGQTAQRRQDLDQLMRALEHLSIQEYADEEPDPMSPVARFELRGLGDEPLDVVEVRRQTNGTAVYGRSTYSGSWTTLIPSTAAELVRALDRLEAVQSADE